jgi:hypothetical protein
MLNVEGARRVVVISKDRLLPPHQVCARYPYYLYPAHPTPPHKQAHPNGFTWFLMDSSGDRWHARRYSFYFIFIFQAFLYLSTSTNY